MNTKRINWLQWQMDKLDTEILLAYVLGVSRSYLHTWPEKKILSIQQQTKFDELIKRRAQGEPIAYLVGHQEFWSLPLEVNQHTLVPRPETELLVELVLTIFSKRENVTIADLGTGSGAIALAIAHEQPYWRILATDKSYSALDVAKRNAKQLNLTNIDFYSGYWFQALPVDTKCDVIVSNPPYIAQGDPHLQQAGVCYEPLTALVSGQEGLDAIRHIIAEAWEYLIPGGWLLVEHGYDQAIRVRDLFHTAGYNQIRTYQDLGGCDRVTTGQKNMLYSAT